jgi:hypothetical protein
MITNRNSCATGDDYVGLPGMNPKHLFGHIEQNWFIL